MMNYLFLTSYVALWVLVFGMGFLLLGTLRSLGVLSWQFEEMEATRPVRKGREGLKPGTTAPEFRLPDLQGVDRALADYAGKEQLLVFVQPGCGPCHEIVPDLNRLQQAGEVQIVGIINGDQAEARQWADEVHAAFPVLQQEKWAVSKAYKTYATPFGYLIDGQGRVKSRGLVGSSQYLRYVLSGAGSEQKSHLAEAPEPAREALPRPVASSSQRELAPV